MPLRATIELLKDNTYHPIAEVIVVNDRRGTYEIGNYTVRATVYEDERSHLRWFRIDNWDRSRPASALIAEALTKIDPILEEIKRIR